MNKPNFTLIFSDFFEELAKGQIEIYNEFSFQHELGIYLRNKLSPDYKIQFERNISFFDIPFEKMVKKEIDIVVFNQLEKYAIELKYPRNGQYPEQMFKVCQDINFLEQLNKSGFTGCFFIMAADDPLFYSGNTEKNQIYSYFRENKMLHGKIVKPTGKKDDFFDIHGFYKIDWINIKKNIKRFILKIGF